MSDEEKFDDENEMETEDLKDESEKSDGDNSEEDDEMDEDEESILMKKYIEILQKIEVNKFNYDDYVELVNTAHLLNDLDKIRQSYELFSAIYPLSPEIWLRWIKIESNLSSSDEELENVSKLYDRSLVDYFSTEVALEYAKHALKCSRKREIFDKILPMYSLSCLDGGQLYKIWRDDFTKTEPESPEKLQKLIKSYENELKLPLHNMENNYIEFKLLIEKNKATIGEYDYETFERRYNRAKDALQKIYPFEIEAQKLDSKMHKERVELYLRYIRDCEDCMDDNFLQAVHEKMVTDCCLATSVWLQYLKFYDMIKDDETDEVDTVFPYNKIDLVTRALKNCPWSVELHIEKLRIYEKSKSASKDEYKNAFEQSILMGFSAPEPYVEIWLEYLSSMRRSTNFHDESQVEVLRKNFQFAWNSLGQQWGALADQNCEILQLWGRLEYGKLNDMMKGRELWTTIMESGDNSTRSGMWIEFANLETRRNVDAARKIFKKTISIVDLDNIQTVVYAWIGFERCHGTLDTLRSCQRTCNEVMKVTASRARHDRKKIESSPKKTATKRSHDDPPMKKKPDVDEKRMKFDENTNDVDPTKDNVTVFVSNLDYNITEEEVGKIFNQMNVVKINLIKNATGRGRGFGYVEFSNDVDVQKALELDRTPLNGRPTYISSCLRDKAKREKFKFSEEIEPSKLFVKGIPYDATKEELEEMFGKHGELKDVRIVYHKNGKSKGIAYIEFVNVKSATDAIMKLDQTKFRDTILHVAISAPPPHQSTKSQPPILKTLKGLGKRTNRNDPSGSASLMKPRMSLIPQSVQKKLQNNGTAAMPPPSSGDVVTKKTNDDFRKMILGQK